MGGYMLRRLLVAALAALILTAGVTAIAATDDPTSTQAIATERPHEDPAGSSLRVGGPSGEELALAQAVAVAEWIAAEEARLAEEARVAAELEAARIAEEQAAAARRRAPTSRVNNTYNGVGECTGFPIPDYIIQRESGGNPAAHNPSGAHGCSQTLMSHYRPDGGTCAGMDPNTVDGQRDCTQALVDADIANGGDGLRPWAQTR